MKIYFPLNIILIIQSGYKFADVTTAQLSWHVQSCGLIWSLLVKQETHEFVQTIFRLWAHKSFVQWLTCLDGHTKDLSYHDDKCPWECYLHYCYPVQSHPQPGNITAQWASNAQVWYQLLCLIKESFDHTVEVLVTLYMYMYYHLYGTTVMLIGRPRRCSTKRSCQVTRHAKLHYTFQINFLKTDELCNK